MNKTEKIQKWFLENEPSDDFKYKNHWWENNFFIRDNIVNFFNDKEAEVVGTHYSKSILCPVVKTYYKDVEILVMNPILVSKALLSNLYNSFLFIFIFLMGCLSYVIGKPPKAPLIIC